jgi:hypothetical protein
MRSGVVRDIFHHLEQHRKATCDSLVSGWMASQHCRIRCCR